MIKTFLCFSNKHIFYDDDDHHHLPIPVCSGIKPSMGTEFISNTLLSLGRFCTEKEIILNDTVRGCFSNAKLIGKEDDSESLQNYPNHVVNIFVNNQLLFLSNVQRMIEVFKIQAGDVLDSVIVNNDITIYEMPEVQLLALLLEHDEVFEQFKK